MLETATHVDTVSTGPEGNGGVYTLPTVSYLRESVASDVLSLSLHVGALAMLLAASLRPDAKGGLRACRHLLHDDHKALKLALRYAPEIGFEREAAQKLAGVCDALCEAQRRLAPLSKGPEMGRVQRDQTVAEATAWRRLASEMSAALAMVARSFPGRLNSVFTDDAGTLSEFLKRAAQGDASAVDAAGVIHLPVLKQRRQKPRIAVNLPCTLTTEAGSTPAKLENVSRHGLGLVSAAPLAVHQSVTVTMPDNRRLAAVVARGKPPRYGLKLSEPLAERDPLLLGASPPDQR